MKTITIVLAAALFASTAVSASAQETSAETYSGYTGFVSTKTRAEVKAELRLTQQRGEVVSGEQYPAAVLDAAVSQGKTRAEVRAEALAQLKTKGGASTESSL
jgi:predicted secreted Zn-dependent protease